VGVSWKDYFTTLPTVELYPELFFKNQGTKVVPIAARVGVTGDDAEGPPSLAHTP
jgi:hypothetical protein